jgi:hypothetical protein
VRLSTARVGSCGNHEQYHRDRHHLLALQELHGIDDEKPQSLLGRERLGEPHPEQRRVTPIRSPKTISGGVAGSMERD